MVVVGGGSGFRWTAIRMVTTKVKKRLANRQFVRGKVH